MTSARDSVSAATRQCPHCRATILERATVCPGCKHHLRFDPTAKPEKPLMVPLQIDGTIRQPPGGDVVEYSIVIAVRNARGEEVTRQVVGVGAIGPNDARTFELTVEVHKKR